MTAQPRSGRSTKTPVVKVRRSTGTGDIQGQRVVVWCHEPGCEYVYIACAVTDTQDHARWHREHHRQEARS